MIMELKILKANTSNLFKVLMDRKRIMSFLNCTYGRRRGKDHRSAKALEASLERRQEKT
jgi:hypothetical protein